MTKIKCDAKGCDEQIEPYDIHETISGGHIHGVNLCEPHNKYLSGG